MSFLQELGKSAAGGIVGAAGDLISGGLGQLFNSMQAKRDHEYFVKRSDYQQKLQHETMDKQQQQAIDFWNMQNEYNDPTAVADRYRNAGINPLSAFGGSVVGLGASSAPMPSAGSAYGAGAGGSSAVYSSGDIAGTALKFSNIKRNEEEMELKKRYQDGLDLVNNSRVRLNDSEIDLNRKEGRRLDQLYDYCKDLYPVNLDRAKQELDNARSIGDEIIAKIDNTKADTDKKRKEIEGIQIANDTAALQYTILEKTGLRTANANIAMIYSNVRYTDQMTDNAYIDMLQKPVKLNLEYINTMCSALENATGASLNSASRDKIIKEANNIEFENGLKVIDRFISIWNEYNHYQANQINRENNKNNNERSRQNNQRSNETAMLRTLLYLLITKGK